MRVTSWELAGEPVSGLRRPKPRRYGLTEQDVDDVLVLLSPLLPTVETGVVIRDPGDVPVVARALAGNADAIVTGDGDFLADEALARPG